MLGNCSASPRPSDDGSLSHRDFRFRLHAGILLYVDEELSDPRRTLDDVLFFEIANKCRDAVAIGFDPERPVVDAHEGARALDLMAINGATTLMRWFRRSPLSPAVWLGKMHQTGFARSMDLVVDAALHHDGVHHRKNARTAEIVFFDIPAIFE